ncbi:hypothetical protein MCEMSE15_02975 [Fimbriimonadaceae bacterium]
MRGHGLADPGGIKVNSKHSGEDSTSERITYQKVIFGLLLICIVAIFGWLLVVYPVMQSRVGQMQEFIATQKPR